MPILAPQSRRSDAFTLVELLVAMSVLVMLLVALTAVTDSTRKTIGFQNARLDSQQAVADVFTQMDRDIASRVTIPGAQFYWGKNVVYTGSSSGASKGQTPITDEIAFYTERQGYRLDNTQSSDHRQTSWIHYRATGTSIERGATGLVYSGSSTSASTSTTTAPAAVESTIRAVLPTDPLKWSSYTQIPAEFYQELSTQIVRMEISALVEDEMGKVLVKNEPPRNLDQTINTILYPRKAGDPKILRGIVVSLVAMDSRDLVLLKSDPSEQLAKIAKQFPDMESEDVLPSSKWASIAEHAPALAGAAEIPLRVAQNLRVFERIYRIHP